jgi:hypothetical protein
MRFKVSVLTGPVNPAALRVWAGLGADSVNVPSDLTVAQVAELRQASPVALDLYLEAPDDVGGFVRLYDAAELIRIAAPVYLKFGLRNAPGIYPVGRHLSGLAADTGRERVRRGRLTLDIVERSGGAPLPMSPVGDPALPECKPTTGSSASARPACWVTPRPCSGTSPRQRAITSPVPTRLTSSRSCAG